MIENDDYITATCPHCKQPVMRKTPWVYTGGKTAYHGKCYQGIHETTSIITQYTVYCTLSRKTALDYIKQQVIEK